MTTTALTPQERQELNAWIAEHVYGWTDIRPWKPEASIIEGTKPNGKRAVLPNFFTWRNAGPLFDRYEWVLEHQDGVYTIVDRDNDCYEFCTHLATGTTGPEAIAKAVKAWEETKR